MRIRVTLPDVLVAFADEEARRRETTRSGLIAELLEAERVRRDVSAYIDRHGWDFAEDESAWRAYQKRRMSEEYGSDEW